MSIAHKPFFSRLSYSFGNEDWRVERKALNIKPTDRVVCVTASGDRPLNLLMDPCAELISIDLNETQNLLLSLKVHAMRNLGFNEYLSFLGASECNKRLENLVHLTPKLEKRSGLFWNQHKSLIHHGVLYQGVIEKWCKKFAGLMNLLRGKKIKRLFEFDNLAEQQQFVKEEWNSYLWQKSCQLIGHPQLTRLMLSDPGLYAYLGPKISPAKYIFDRMNKNLNSSLAKHNPLLSLLFRGYVDKDSYPAYLTEQGHGIIKQRLNKLHWKQDNLINFLEKSPPKSFDCFSVSDIASYMPETDFSRLLRAIHRAAKPGARFSIRQFMSDHSMPEDLKPHYRRNHALEKELEDEECCFVYRFIAGTIKK